jgi:sarcosine oxidase, subunit alpha
VAGLAPVRTAIRRAAGLAPAPTAPPDGRFEVRNAHCDVLVAGAGPAGLMAALVGRAQGARVMLVDEGSEAGGNLLARHAQDRRRPALDWVARVVAELAAMPDVVHLQHATVWGWREHNLLMVQERSPGAPVCASAAGGCGRSG